MAVALSLGLNNLIFIGNLSDMSESYQATMEAFYSSPLAIQIVVLVVLVPVSEELVFRGLLFRRLRERASYMQAALYGSVKAPIAAHMVMNLFSVLATEYNLTDWLAHDQMRIGIVTVGCAFVASTMFVLIQRIDEKPDAPGTSGEKENLVQQNGW